MSTSKSRLVNLNLKVYVRVREDARRETKSETRNETC